MPRTRKPVPEPPTDEKGDLMDPPDDGTQTQLVAAAIEVFNPDFENLNLWGKIARITGMIGSVEKRGYNAFHKYHYVMEGDLVGAVRQYLAAANIVIIPNAHKWEFHGDICMVDIEYTVTDGKEFFTFSMPGAGADRGDKGVYKAITGSQKYALMKLFKIETGDDPESDTRVDERAATQEPSRPVRVTSGNRAGVRRGGHTEKASPIQIRRVAEAMKELDMSREELVPRIMAITGAEVVLPDDTEGQQKAILAALQDMTSEQVGELIIGLTDVLADRTAESQEGATGPYG